jgi:hypothetical protein
MPPRHAPNASSPSRGCGYLEEKPSGRPAPPGALRPDAQGAVPRGQAPPGPRPRACRPPTAAEPHESAAYTSGPQQRSEPRRRGAPRQRRTAASWKTLAARGPLLPWVEEEGADGIGNPKVKGEWGGGRVCIGGARRPLERRRGGRPRPAERRRCPAPHPAGGLQGVALPHNPAPGTSSLPPSCWACQTPPSPTSTIAQHRRLTARYSPRAPGRAPGVAPRAQMRGGRGACPHGARRSAGGAPETAGRQAGRGRARPGIAGGCTGRGRACT